LLYFEFIEEYETCQLIFDLLHFEYWNVKILLKFVFGVFITNKHLYIRGILIN
jgi:hypothetical protein